MTHDIIAEEFDRHLDGLPEGRAASRAFYAHLEACPACRDEVAQMEELSGLLRQFRAEPDLAPVEPRLGFYNRVAGQIVESQRREAWGLFSPGVAFFRRIAFASLLLLAGLGSYLVARESAFDNDDAAAIMAQHDPSAELADAADRDRLLVTMSTYRE